MIKQTEVLYGTSYILLVSGKVFATLSLSIYQSTVVIKAFLMKFVMLTSATVVNSTSCSEKVELRSEAKNPHLFINKSLLDLPTV